jgi:hypothetical protein
MPATTRWLEAEANSSGAVLPSRSSGGKALFRWSITLAFPVMPRFLISSRGIAALPPSTAGAKP